MGKVSGSCPIIDALLNAAFPEASAHAFPVLSFNSWSCPTIAVTGFIVSERRLRSYMLVRVLGTGLSCKALSKYGAAATEIFEKL
jgi:hypothetical protein